MGVYNGRTRILATAGVAVADARCAVVRPKGRRISFDEPAASRSDSGGVVPGVPQTDGSDVAERASGGAFRAASVTCGISGMGFGAEGCAERFFLGADDAGVRGVCQGVQSS